MSSPADQLIELLRQQAHAAYIGEPVNQLEHALQCAALAQEAGADEPLILAALLHDIGHICDPRAEPMGKVGVLHHEHIGAEYVRSMGLTAEIATLIENHVNAKRYLVQRSNEYAAKLSSASIETLGYQGGPMSVAEAAEFEQVPLFQDFLRLRAWDEAAKVPATSVLDVERVRAMLRRNLARPLSEGQLRSWREQGYLRISDWFSTTEVAALQGCVEGLQALPETPGKWMKYYEPGKAGKQLCRIENFLAYNSQMRQVLTSKPTLALLAALFGEPACLYKEKVNFKLPGGNGFKAHQDAPAFTTFGQDYHITMMLSFDATTPENGCLEVVPGAHQRGLLAMEPDLTLSPAEVEQLTWVPVPTAPGDILLFDSFLPHRSHSNTTNRARRALYATYNRLRDGDVRHLYFEQKRAAFPPDVERVPGRTYDAGVFNIGNPVTTD
ncbi:MAG: phytanoyl-CoA dioxygenase family protein [Pseudomonadota bacterium]